MQCGKSTGSPSKSRLWDLQQAVSNRSKRSLHTLEDNMAGTLLECGERAQYIPIGKSTNRPPLGMLPLP